VIAVDTNLLIFAHRADSPFQRDAVAALKPLLEGTSAWALPWPCVHEFISIATNPRIYKPASTLEEALGFLDSTLGSPHLNLLSESQGYFEKLRHVAKAGKISGPRIHDARIAALCIHHGVSELWSADRDFSSFPQLKVRNPLIKV
jgi:toxin-antitoxin system PIN domain toxin